MPSHKTSLVGVFCAAALSASFFIGCAPGKPPRFSGLGPDEIALRLAANRKAVRSFTSSGRLYLQSPGVNRRSDFAFAWDAKLGARMDLLTPFFTPIATFVYTDGALHVRESGAPKKFFDAHDAVESYAGIDVKPDLLFQMLAGSIDFPETGFARRSPPFPKQKKQNSLWFAVTDSASGANWLIEFDASRGALTGAYLCAKPNRPPAGSCDPALIFKATDFIEDQNAVFPKRIELSDGRGKSLEVVHDRVELNGASDPNLFKLE